jgi:hypothetical protein
MAAQTISFFIAHFLNSCPNDNTPDAAHVPVISRGIVGTFWLDVVRAREQGAGGWQARLPQIDGPFI